MDTPICDFVRHYAQSAPLRLHMPGHKGEGPLGVEHLDITEVEGADVLYRGDGIIRRSENHAAALFGSGRTLYSAEGSSLAIRAMVDLAVLYAKSRGERPRIAAGRNAHKVFLTATALLDVEVDWLYPTRWESLLSCNITPQELEEYLARAEELPTAVYLTSPDYLGHMADVAGMAAVCRARGVLLLVDNAHGAYLNFLTPSRHPMALGADLCCDSAHKTLPVLTGGAYLHISKTAPALLAEQAERAMALFASTSPSYLILQSLDGANRTLAEGYAAAISAFASEVDRLKTRLRGAGWSLLGEEPLKVTLAPKSRGYTGEELAERMRTEGMVCEYADPDHLVLMFTPKNGERALARVEELLCALPPKDPISARPPLMAAPRRACTPREALLSPGEERPLARCLGMVLADPSVSCPPAIPVAVCGEVLEQDALDLMAYYGMTSCRVIPSREGEE